jgi:hypothetical protein
VDRGGAGSYRKAAAQFMLAGGLAREHGYANAAGVLFVHAAIAYADAVSIHLLGQKSSAQDHQEVVQLLSEAAARQKDRDRAVGHLVRLIAEKNRVSYTGDSFRMHEVEALESHARRFQDWAEGRLAP